MHGKTWRSRRQTIRRVRKIPASRNLNRQFPRRLAAALERAFAAKAAATALDLTKIDLTDVALAQFGDEGKLLLTDYEVENLRKAYENTARGKKRTFGYLEFKEFAEANLLRVQEELLDGGYRIGSYRQFTVYEPKARLISALDFKDRLVQHAVCNIISPIFERGLLPQTFACRVGLGTHAGVRFIQAKLRYTEAKYFLKTDYSKFFPSIDRAVLHTMIDRKIDCAKTLDILREIIPTTGQGIPIGSPA